MLKDLLCLYPGRLKFYRRKGFSLDFLGSAPAGIIRKNVAVAVCEPKVIEHIFCEDIQLECRFCRKWNMKEKEEAERKKKEEEEGDTRVFSSPRAVKAARVLTVSKTGFKDEDGSLLVVASLVEGTIDAMPSQMDVFCWD